MDEAGSLTGITVRAGAMTKTEAGVFTVTKPTAVALKETNAEAGTLKVETKACLSKTMSGVEPLTKSKARARTLTKNLFEAGALMESMNLVLGPRLNLICW